MKFITGDTRSKRFVEVLQRYGWGRMVIDQKIQPYPGEPWCFDNGAWRDFKNGRAFVSDNFISRLHMAEEIGTPYMAVVPDIVCGGYGSLAFSIYWINQPELQNDWPWYLAVQNGMTLGMVEDAVSRYPFKGIFLGGDDQFKYKYDANYADLAHNYGLKFHYARCGTKRKIRRAIGCKADSLDSSFPLWTGDRFASIASSLASLEKLTKIVEWDML